METRRYICRKEIFGAILHDRLKRKSIFVSQRELNDLELNKQLDVDGNIVHLDEVRIVNNICLPDDTFSAPDGIYFEITRECNLRCSHCFNSSGKKFGAEWSWPDISSLFNRFYEIGVLSIRFTGGEPFCSKYLFNALNMASDLGIYTSIGTNGTLVSNTIASRLADSRIGMVNLEWNHYINVLKNIFSWPIRGHKDIAAPVICKSVKHMSKMTIINSNESMLPLSVLKAKRLNYLEKFAGNQLVTKVYFVAGKTYHRHCCHKKTESIQLEKQVHNICDLFKLELASIDFVCFNNEYYVLDVNHAPAYRGNNDAFEQFIIHLSLIKN